MKYDLLNETIAVKTISETESEGVFEIEGLYTGYGTTVGNALRRVLLSSLPGAAITQVKVKGVSHEFSTIEGVSEDMVEILLNLKRVRFRMHTDEPQTLSLKKKGEGSVTGGDIASTAEVEVITPDTMIATITEKSAEFDLELTVEKGLGYVPAEMRKSDKLPIGVVAVDAIYSPVTKVNFTVENMRVGDRTDYNKIRMTIETDGSITPSYAFQKAGTILQESFGKASAIEVKEVSKTVSEKDEKKPIAKRKKKAS